MHALLRGTLKDTWQGSVHRTQAKPLQQLFRTHYIHRTYRVATSGCPLAVMMMHGYWL